MAKKKEFFDFDTIQALIKVHWSTWKLLLTKQKNFHISRSLSSHFE